MKPDQLKKSLNESARNYARVNSLTIDESHPTAIIFARIEDAFHPASYEEIQGNAEWNLRLGKAHPKVAGVAEMQSSNSSDALLMNIFCHPQIGQWKGVRQLLNWDGAPPEFGAKPRVEKAGTTGDETELDLVLGGLFVEAKLTEGGFTDKETGEVEKYSGFSEAFHVESLPRSGSGYANYQVIRNLLASIQHGKAHALFCDERRPDLVRSYFETVACLKDIEWRNRCRVVFWQEIVRACGKDLASFLELKYGIV